MAGRRRWCPVKVLWGPSDGAGNAVPRRLNVFATAHYRLNFVHHLRRPREAADCGALAARLPRQTEAIMAADRAHSPAYLAMKPSGRRCLDLIESALTHRGGDTAALSHGQFKAWGVARCSSCYAVKALVALGFVTVASGKRRANVFRLCEDWRALDASEAARLEQSAREAKPQPRAARWCRSHRSRSRSLDRASSGGGRRHCRRCGAFKVRLADDVAAERALPSTSMAAFTSASASSSFLAPSRTASASSRE